MTGGWLRCGGRLYLKGLGVHSRARLVYNLAEAKAQGAEGAGRGAENVGRGAWGVGRDGSPLPPGEGQKSGSPRPLGEGQGVRGTKPTASDQRPVVSGQGVRATRFCADLGIDDSTAGQGSVQFHVLVDGQEKFTSKTIRGGDAPVPVSIDLTGVKRLELLVDYADRGDVLDHADWLNARLITGRD